MKKISSLLVVVMLGGMFLLSACTQGQKASEEVKVKKDIYLQLYSLRDDIKADYKATIDSVAKFGYTGIEAAGYGDGQFYGMAPADFKKSIEDAGLEINPPTLIGTKFGLGGTPPFRHTKTRE